MFDLKQHTITLECPSTVSATVSVMAPTQALAHQAALKMVKDDRELWDIEETVIHDEQARIADVSKMPSKDGLGHEPNSRTKVLILSFSGAASPGNVGVYVVRGGRHELTLSSSSADQQGANSVRNMAIKLARSLSVPVEVRINNLAEGETDWTWEAMTEAMNEEQRQLSPFVLVSEGKEKEGAEARYWSADMGWVTADLAQVYQARDVAVVERPSEDARWTISPLAFRSGEDSEENLVNEYRCFCFIESLPYVSADELLFSELDSRQKAWVEDFSERWDQAVDGAVELQD